MVEVVVQQSKAGDEVKTGEVHENRGRQDDKVEPIPSALNKEDLQNTREREKVNERQIRDTRSKFTLRLTTITTAVKQVAPAAWKDSSTPVR